VSDVLSTVYYIDATNGNDNFIGTTEAEAWKTLNKVKLYGEKNGYFPGDKILLKKGEVWNERLYAYGAGISENNVIYSYYGIGDNPIVSQIYHRKYLSSVVPRISGYITFDSISITGSDIGIDAKTINNLTFKNIKIYNCGTGIILNSEDGLLDNWSMEDVTINNCNSFGLFVTSEVNNFHAKRLITFNNAKDGAAFRSGIGNIVEDSLSYGNGEDGFDVGGIFGSFMFLRCISRNNKSAGFSVKGYNKICCFVNNCISYDNDQGLEVGNYSSSYTNNSVFYNNRNIGINFDNDVTQSLYNSIIFKNGELDPIYGMQVAYLNENQILYISNNCYGEHSQKRTIYVKKIKNFMSLEDWKLFLNKIYDQESFAADPQFFDSEKGNFGLMKTSPCINTGKKLDSVYGYGFNPVNYQEMNMRTMNQDDYGSGWEIGAFVYPEIQTNNSAPNILNIY
jgi:hypothetical protein